MWQSSYRIVTDSTTWSCYSIGFIRCCSSSALPIKSLWWSNTRLRSSTAVSRICVAEISGEFLNKSSFSSRNTRRKPCLFLYQKVAQPDFCPVSVVTISLKCMCVCVQVCWWTWDSWRRRKLAISTVLCSTTRTWFRSTLPTCTIATSTFIISRRQLTRCVSTLCSTTTPAASWPSRDVSSFKWTAIRTCTGVGATRYVTFRLFRLTTKLAQVGVR